MVVFLGVLIFLNLALPTSTEDRIPLLNIYPKPTTIYVDKVDIADTKLRNQVESYIKMYEESVGDNLFYRPGTSPITIRVSKIDQTKNKDGIVTLATATVYFHKCDINLDDKIWRFHELYYVLLHELGHCYGYDHDQQYNRVMSKYYSYNLGYEEEMMFLRELKSRASPPHSL